MREIEREIVKGVARLFWINEEKDEDNSEKVGVRGKRETHTKSE